MTIGTLRELTLAEIADLLRAEERVSEAFGGLVFATHDTVTTAVADDIVHTADVRRVRLHAIRDRMGAEHPGITNGAMDGLVAEGHERTAQATNEVVREAIRVASAAEWTTLLETRYRVATCHLRQLGRVEESHLLDESAKEMHRATERLLRLDNQQSQTALLAEATAETGLPSDVSA